MKIVLTFCLFIVSVMAFAQVDSSANVNVLTFDEAVKIALDNSVNLNTQRNNL
jgi:hypothetical protein